MGDVDLFGGYVGNELLFRLQGRFCTGGQADPRRHPENMRIHGHIGLLMDHGGDHVRCFPSYARQSHQGLYRGWDFPIEVLRHFSCHSRQVFCFVVWITDGADERKYFLGTCLAQRPDIGEPPEKRGRRHVYPFIRALCGKYDGYQQFVGIVVQ